LNSTWRVEISAVFRKEWLNELRTRSGLVSSFLFSVVAVVAVALATFGQTPDPTVAAGLLWVTLLFSAILALPRSFIGEEETGTADLLRLIARPHAVFWGKSLFNLLQMLITALILSTLFLMLTDLRVKEPTLLIGAVIGGCAALALAVTLCGALVAQAANRAALAGAIGLPLLLPLMLIAIGATRVPFGAGSVDGGMQSMFGLYCYALLVGSIAPFLFAAVWKS